jgi:putative transposase
MAPLLFGLFTWLSAFFRSRYNLSLEIIAFRQQLGVLKRKTPRPRYTRRDRVFWILLRRIWPSWSNALIVVKPETVVAWFHSRALGVYTTDMIGSRLPEEVSS